MQTYLRGELPDLRDEIRQARYLAVDLEMTGMDASSDHILSIGYVPVDSFQVVLKGA